MDYNNVIELDNVTLEDCIDLHKMKSISTIINDGKIATFVKERD